MGCNYLSLPWIPALGTTRVIWVTTQFFCRMLSEVFQLSECKQNDRGNVCCKRTGNSEWSFRWLYISRHGDAYKYVNDMGHNGSDNGLWNVSHHGFTNNGVLSIRHSRTKVCEMSIKINRNREIFQPQCLSHAYVLAICVQHWILSTVKAQI